ncbi:MAG TPA: hypothetical protein VMG99_08935 [Thermoplasmata archaeon]|nr:hypothetical protein [Thermoplasmata archaeon]
MSTPSLVADLPPGTYPKCSVVNCPETKHLKRVRIPGARGHIERFFCPDHLRSSVVSMHPDAVVSEEEYGEPDDPRAGPLTSRGLPDPLLQQLTERLESARLLASGEATYDLVSTVIERVDRKGKQVPRITLVLEGR